MKSTSERLCDQVSKDELFEDGDIPKVDKEQTQVAGEKEGEGEGVEVEEGLEVHPGDDDHPHHEGHQVDLGVPLEREGSARQAGDEVDDPGLVEHRVHLGHQAEDCETNSSVLDEGAGEAGDDEQVVDQQLGGVLLQHHVDRLSQVDPDGEGGESLGRLRRLEHEVLAHLATCNQRIKV